uniref:Uncharacterized protein n=1 Tax=Oryza glumipatula TaxID=40148 RepID=A0A0D9Y987_9ORYZ
MRWHPDMWRPRGSHADSTATSDKTGFKTTEGPIAAAAFLAATGAGAGLARFRLMVNHHHH